MRSLTIQIPKPCHERWDDMLPAEQGRFCASCQKTVVDYTSYSDPALIRALRKVPNTACGRFLDEQLNRPLITPKQGIQVWRHWAGLLTMSFLGLQTAKGQSNSVAKAEPLAVVRPAYSLSLNPTQNVTDSSSELVISGRVMLADSSNNLSASTGTTVSIYQVGLPRGWLARTDDGTFNLSVPIGMLVQKGPAQESFALRIYAFSSDGGRASTEVSVKPTTLSVTLEDLIIYPSISRKSISGGGICTIPAPTRWQKLKRKLFR